MRRFDIETVRVPVLLVICSASIIDVIVEGTSVDESMFASVLGREFSGSSPARFRREAACGDLVERTKRIGTLDGHDGCVNTASFTPCGDGLLTGSDDMLIILWDWQTGEQKLKYSSGHRNNVFQARALPHTGNRTIVTCAADGQVRVGHVSESGRVETSRLAKHEGRAHKLALLPEDPTCFLSCGEDGVVRHFDLRAAGDTGLGRRLLVCRSGYGGGSGGADFNSPVELNSIHCNPARPWQFAVGGGDPVVRVYDQRRASLPSATATGAASLAAPVRKLTPSHLRKLVGKRGHNMHVTCAMFSSSGELVATYNDEDIYLFASDQQNTERSAAAAGIAGRPKRARSEEPAQPDRLAAAGPAGGAAAAAEGRPNSGSGAASLPETDWPFASSRLSQPSRLQQQGQQRNMAMAAQRQQQMHQMAAAGSSGSAGGIPNGMDLQEDDESPGLAAGRGGGSLTRSAPDSSLAAIRDVNSGQPQQQQCRSSGSDWAGDVDQGMATSSSDQQHHSSSSAEPTSDSAPLLPREDPPTSPDASSPSPPPPRLRRRRRNAFLLPEAVLSQRHGAIADSSSDEEAEEPAAAAPAATDNMPDDVLQRYSGHRNSQTVKGVAFCGASDEFVMSGSDCGHMFIWDKVSGRLRVCVKGDENVVNCLEQSPTLPLTIATSGIDHSVKLWAPVAEAPRALGPEVTRLCEANKSGRNNARRPQQIMIPHRLLARLLARHGRSLFGLTDSSDDGSDSQGHAAADGSEELAESSNESSRDDI